MTSTEIVPTTEYTLTSHRDAASVEQTFVANLEDHWRLAKMLVMSGLLPNAVKEPEQAMAIMLKGHELNLPPMQSFSSIHIIDGKPSLAASLMMALCIRDAGCVFETLRKDAEGCEIEIRRPGWKPYVARFLKEDAERVKIKTRNGSMRLTEKDNWRNYPTSMYFSRAASDACRTVCPDILAGMYTPEELGATVDETGDVILVGAPAPEVKTDPALEQIRAAVQEVGDRVVEEKIEERDAELASAEPEEPAETPEEAPLKEGVGPAATDVEMPKGLYLARSSPGWYLVCRTETAEPVSDRKFHKADGKAFAERFAVAEILDSVNDLPAIRRAIGVLLESVGWDVKTVGDFAQTLYATSDGLTDDDGRVIMSALGAPELRHIWSAVYDALEAHRAGEEVRLVSRDTLEVAVLTAETVQDDLGI